MRVGTVESLWRYPVKSMHGERMATAFLGFPGIYGDRIFAITSTACPEGFPFLTGRQQQAMLQYQPRFRDVASAAQPPGLSAAEQLAPGSNLTRIYADLALEVRTPSGEDLAIDDPALLRQLSAGLDPTHVLTLVRSQRALTDCRPISLFSVQSARQLQQEIGLPVDQRRFRANINVELASDRGFGEDDWVGHTLRIGAKVTIKVLERDQRCKMITLDPDTGESNPAYFKGVKEYHQQRAGVYGAVLVEGLLHEGDPIELLD